MEEGIMKGIAYYLLEAHFNLEGTFREYDRLLDDRNMEKASRLKTEIAQVRQDLKVATEILEKLLEQYRMRLPEGK